MLHPRTLTFALALAALSIASPAQAQMDPKTKAAFDVCTKGAMPGTSQAEKRAAACSEAIQSKKLAPSELAQARFDRAGARMALGNKVMAESDYRDALRRYDSAIDPKNPAALDLFRRGATLDALGQGDRALKDFNDAIRVDPKSTLAYYGRGVMLATRTRAYQRAIEDFDKVLTLEPDNVDALIHRGDSYRQIGNYGRALADLDAAVAKEPDNAEALAMRGLANSSRGETILAKRDYDAALVIDPHNVDALVRRATLDGEGGALRDAIADLTTALSIEDNNATAHYNRGTFYLRMSDYERALADFRSAIELDSTLGPAYTNRCLVRAILGRDLVGALADCDTALRMLPGNLDVRDTRGFTYLTADEPAIAVVEYSAALQADPNRALSLYGRGLAYSRDGRTKDGEADMAAAKALVPDVAKQFSIYGLE